MQVELRLLALIFVAVLFGATGFMCLFHPYRVQRYAIAMSQRQRFNPFKRWITTRSYIWSLRTIGVLSLPCFLVITLFALETRFGALWYTRDICAVSQIEPRDFFDRGLSQREIDFKTYNLDTQYCLYIYGITGREPPDLELQPPFAEGGAKTIQLLKTKIPTASPYFMCPPILDLLDEINRLGTYDVVADHELLAAVHQRLKDVDDPGWKERCEGELADLEHASRRSSRAK
jgi:hypothetical protein